MIVGSVRSGLVEAVHPVVAAAVDASGRVIAIDGEDRERPFFVRSALKPFQAAVSVRNGADLGEEQLALASASHGAQPVHVAIVQHMLLDVGLEAEHLRCPPARPLSGSADRGFAAAGRAAPERVFNNCSGKHAAMLRACIARDWPLEYTAQDHPLQRQVLEFGAEVTGRLVEPAGIDGCGVPTVRSDVIGLANAFARLASDPDLRTIAAASSRFGALTSDGDRPEAILATWFAGPVKGGAMGCVGAAWTEGGIGFGAKCWTGQLAPAMVGLVSLMDRVGVLAGHPRAVLDELARPAVTGGGRVVGALEVLQHS